ncbi:Na+ dependent nucleoside transporter C-terminus-domain-containing protein [Suillus subaureus]|uniref:Na+ dependent nucleoside transporter C-terminus-domain-containing protein n=1 Tax=Suillus subaureus TaxID=48587 RepID=A0A9P7JDC3_9AGAM|nr:Na+ dependent nucleoside transporter C-terminus-domain-containing protein [Suillus subaureus]KAG1816042.1 Na+ dependent nucleoside transporter C-terminus-domain-containing protein [Suillus subaureus]
MAAPAGDFDADNQFKFIQRKTSVFTNSDREQEIAPVVDAGGDLEGAGEKDEGTQARSTFDKRLRVVILIFLAALILGWWISSTILTATRGQWVVQSFFAWFFLLIIAFRFIPNSVVTEPITAIWMPCIQVPWYKLPRTARLTIGWLCLLAIVFGSAFGFSPTGNSDYGHRAISVLGLFVFQCGFYLCSTNRSAICWPTVVVGLFLQQTIALFVLKTGAGYSLFKYIADLANDFLSEADVGAEFFFDAETIAKKWFFVNVLSAIIFFIATIQMLYYLGAMQWMVKGFAWFFFKLMNVSGAEAVVAAASPWVGQGESACLVKPYVDIMTPSELHLIMTSGFSTISGSVLTAYVALGVPPQNLVTSSVMSIPASIAISKMRIPEVEEPVTRGRIVVDRGDAGKNQPVNALHAFSLGGLFGLNVAGQILTNVLTILSLVATINAVLTWVGRGFGIHQLTLQLVLGYIGYPIAFFLGVPSAEILRVSQLLATKLIENEFAAYLELSSIQASSNPLSHRAFTIASYSLCGFANLGSLGIQIGVLGALAPSRGKVIAKLAVSAMICGFISCVLDLSCF